MLKFFDCNCMIGGIAGTRLPTHSAAELQEELRHYSIDRALVFHSGYGPTYDNELLLQALSGKNNLYPVASAMPWETSLERLTEKTREMLETKSCGVRLFPAADRYDFSGGHLSDILEIVDRRGLPVMIDADQASFGALAQMLKSYPKVAFILAKIGCANMRHVYELFSAYSNFFVETSLFRSFNGIEDAVAKFGADRILFGSYMPLLDGGAAVTRILYSGLNKPDVEKIAYGNLETLLSRIRR